MGGNKTQKVQQFGEGCLANLQALGGCFFLGVIGIPIIIIGVWFLWGIIKFALFEMNWG